MAGELVGRSGGREEGVGAFELRGRGLVVLIGCGVGGVLVGGYRFVPVLLSVLLVFVLHVRGNKTEINYISEINP